MRGQSKNVLYTKTSSNLKPRLAEEIEEDIGECTVRRIKGKLTSYQNPTVEVFGGIWKDENIILEESGILWMKNGLLHKKGEPAVVLRGTPFQSVYYDKRHELFIQGAAKLYYQHGQLHRTDGPAIIISEDGLYGSEYPETEPPEETGPYLEYRQKGVLHREDGPAIIKDDDEWYFLNGQYQP